MRKALIFLSLIYSNGLFSQFITIQDDLLKKPIENVTLRFEATGVVSNSNGIANISKFRSDDIIEISHVSYQTKKIRKKNIRKKIYLTQKENTLPMVFLIEEMKLSVSEKHPVFTIRPKRMDMLESSVGNLLSRKSPVVVQESQPGGGSPNYRGMEANRLLLVVDGIQLNNAIFRSGHLQNSATINPFFIQSVSLVSGPASVAYGSGAMGGALVFNTLQPLRENSVLFYQQFESSSNTVLSNFRANYYSERMFHTTGFSLKSAENLNMGETRFHNYKTWGLEKHITQKNKQLYTSYQKGDFIHKTKYNINKRNNVVFNTQYSRSSKIYRFDKMNDVAASGAKYKHWYYGPQIRFLQNISYESRVQNLIFDIAKTTVSFQNTKESRHTQKKEEELLNNRSEDVKIYDFNFDVKKTFHPISMSYGLGGRHQNVLSNASLTNTHSTFYNTTRYPNGGSSIQDYFAYSQINISITKKSEILLGGRWNNSRLNALFNNSEFNFKKIEAHNNSFVKSVLFSLSPVEKIIINASYYGGFRNPNIDDVGKVFSKDGVNVVIPNPNLEPEYAKNLEFNFNYKSVNLTLELQVFNTQIYNAISREYGRLNGADSMMYDNEMMRIQMNKNIDKANINGVSFFTEFRPNKKFILAASCNYLMGEKNNEFPLAHIPPFNGKFSLDYKLGTHDFSFYIDYNAWKKAVNYDASGIDNLDEATPEGNPSWYTINVDYSKKIDNNTTFFLSVKNMLDAHYKKFSSGISASGRNFIFALQTNF